MKARALLFLLACALIASSVSAQTPGITIGRDPHRWEQSIRDFERADRTNRPPRHAVLFVGSSSIRIWKTLAEDFPEHRVINRGFGGSEMEDVLKYANRIVLPYRPRTIVFYAGDNDLYAGKSPEDLLTHFKLFAYKVHEVLPRTRIVLVSVKPSIAHWNLVEKVRRTNALLEEFCATDERLIFVNVYPHMVGIDGYPRPELFKKDGVHLSSEGYALWAKLIRPHLRSIGVPPAPVTRR